MKINEFISRYRKWLIICPVVITVLMLLPLTKARINPDLMQYFPKDIESKINFDSIESIFGKFEPILIVVEADNILDESTLNDLSELHDSLIYLQEIDDVLSLFTTKYIRGEEGTMLVDPVVNYVPSTPEEIETLKAEIESNPLASGIFISKDFKYATFIVVPAEGFTDDQILENIFRIVDLFREKENIYLSGLPYLRYEIQSKAVRDLVILLPLGLIIMLIFLYFSFRERRGVLLPFSVVLMSIAIAMGLMPVLGYDLSIIAILVPIMMIAIANNYGVHIVARYQELNAKNPDWSMKQIVNESVTRLYVPIILTALTTIFGVLGLIVHIMRPAKQMGIVSSVAIAFALIFSLLFIPAILLGMKKGKPRESFKSEEKHSLIDKFLVWSSNVSTKLSLPTIYAFISFLIIVGVGIIHLQPSINFEKMMPVGHSLRTSSNILNNNFGGTKNISILFEGDIKSPEVLKTMDKFETLLKSMPEVGSVNSLSSVIRLISRALNDPGDELYDKIPDDKQTISQYIEFYSMSGDPEDFEKIVDFDYTKALMNVQFKVSNMKDLQKVQDEISWLTNSSPYASLYAGQCLIEKEMAQSVVRGQIYSLVFALLAIVILLWIIFRSPVAGLIGSIPLVLSLICNFGLMGWLGLELDIGNSLLSSVAIGIGVDYTIHLFWRLKYELSQGKTYSDAVTETLKTTGRGIAINAISVIIGFSVLFLSGLVILKTFAFLIIFSLLLCLLSALVFIPALCIVLKPKFLEKNGKYIL